VPKPTNGSGRVSYVDFASCCGCGRQRQYQDVAALRINEEKKIEHLKFFSCLSEI